MTKLTSADIVDIVIHYCEPHVMQRFGYDPETPDEEVNAILDASQNPKKWKRRQKVLVRTFRHDQTIDAMFPDYGWEWIDVIDESIPITDDCICRTFVNDELDSGCCPTVITNPTDDKIISIYWSAD